MYKFLLLMFYLQIAHLNAQVVNIENRRIYDDTLGWSGALDANFSVVNNKEILINSNFRPRIQYKTKKHYFLFLTDWYYSKGANQVFANSGMIHFRYAYRLQRKANTKKSPWKWESYAQVQYNQLLDQRFRALVGSGIRLKVLDRSGYRIFTGTSTFFEYEEIESSNILNKDYRLSNYLSWYFNPKSRLSFSAVTYFQPLWRDLKDFRFMGQYSIMFQVLKRTDLRFECNNYYDSRPADSVRNWMFSATIGVHIRLGE